ncbi:uncharacterized protein LOC131061028 [Cryptomeria japonica]|uniref:uncharacterized protein LOC131061028 n=1 Tax=Cryptomeria japonica TaxID=3369 RepID=UPI0025ABFCE6|nr:uncharacterized protein LOC131061028 [Cryptomeria japonica]
MPPFEYDQALRHGRRRRRRRRLDGGGGEGGCGDGGGGGGGGGDGRGRGRMRGRGGHPLRLAHGPLIQASRTTTPRGRVEGREGLDMGGDAGVGGAEMGGGGEDEYVAMDAGHGATSGRG